MVKRNSRWWKKQNDFNALELPFADCCGVSVKWSMGSDYLLPAASPTVSVTLFPPFALPVPRGRSTCLPDAPNTLLADIQSVFSRNSCFFGCFQAHFLPSLLNSHSARWLPLAPSPIFCSYHESLSLGTLWETDLCSLWFWKSVSMVGIWAASDGLLGYFKLL